MGGMKRIWEYIMHDSEEDFYQKLEQFLVDIMLEGEDSDD